MWRTLISTCDMQYGEFATTLSQEIDGDEKFRATMFARC